jgi:hypothetical protein
MNPKNGYWLIQLDNKYKNQYTNIRVEKLELISPVSKVMEVVTKGSNIINYYIDPHERLLFLGRTYAQAQQNYPEHFI